MDLLDLHTNTIRDLAIILAAIEMNAGKSRDIPKLDMMSAKDRLETDTEYMEYVTSLTIHLLNYMNNAERFYNSDNPLRELIDMIANIAKNRDNETSENGVPVNPNLKNLN